MQEQGHTESQMIEKRPKFVVKTLAHTSTWMLLQEPTMKLPLQQGQLERQQAENGRFG